MKCGVSVPVLEKLYKTFCIRRGSVMNSVISVSVGCSWQLKLEIWAWWVGRWAPASSFTCAFKYGSWLIFKGSYRHLMYSDLIRALSLHILAHLSSLLWLGLNEITSSFAVGSWLLLSGKLSSLAGNTEWVSAALWKATGMCWRHTLHCGLTSFNLRSVASINN